MALFFQIETGLLPTHLENVAATLQWPLDTDKCGFFLILPHLMNVVIAKICSSDSELPTTGDQSIVNGEHHNDKILKLKSMLRRTNR